MGLDYSYLLYFKKEHVWNVLQFLVSIAVPHSPPVSIQFSDRTLMIPLDSWTIGNKTISSETDQFGFTTVLNFKSDEAIEDYLSHVKGDELFRSPPFQDEGNCAIGYIYLDVYQKNPDYPHSNFSLFDFGTPGTRMSRLFYESVSIRDTFTNLLEKKQGVCGVFNLEERGEVFWFQGERLDFDIDDPYLPPEEIEKLILGT